MNKLIIFLFTVTLSSGLLAQGNKPDNAANDNSISQQLETLQGLVETQAAQISELTDQVNALSNSSSSSVAGSTYLTNFIANTLFTIAEFTFQNLRVTSGSSMFTFNDDGTGFAVNNTCDELTMVINGATLGPEITEGDCGSDFGDFTYIQTDNSVVITNEESDVLEFLVSNDGNMFVVAGTTFLDDIVRPSFEFDAAFNSMTVGVRLSD